MEAPWYLALEQKVLQQRLNKPKHTGRYFEHRDGAADAQGKGGQEERYTNPSGPAGDWDYGLGLQGG